VATIERRVTSTGRPRYTVRYRDPGGKSRKDTYTRLDDARERKTEIERQLRRREFIDPKEGRQEFGRFLSEDWLPAITVRASSVSNYATIIRASVQPHLGNVPLVDLRPERLNALYADLATTGGRGGRPLKPKTVRNVHVTIHKALSDAVRWGRLARNVADLADPPKVGRTERATWTAQQLRAFLDATRDDRLGPVWRLFATTGMRRGEVLGLRWSDLDTAAGRLTIVQTVVLIDGKPVIGPPKSARSARTISLDSETASSLASFLTRQKGERLRHGPRYQDSGLVVCNEDGSPIHPDRLSDSFDQAVKRTGLPRLTLHSLRHTHASLAIAAGVPMKVISERLGHASIVITLDLYSHLAPGLDEDAAAKVAGLIQ
jgi:integrase